MLGIAGCFTDIEVCNTRNGYNIAKAGALSLNSFKSLELIEFGYTRIFAGSVIMAKHNGLTCLAGASFDPADTDPADIVIIVYI